MSTVLDAFPMLGIADILDLIEIQVNVRPNHIAVSSRDSRLTYRELDERANGFATLLLQAEVARQAVVGIFLEHSPDFVSAQIGAWKAGAAYLPLNPSAPPERVAFLLKDAGVACVITDANSVARLPADIDARVVFSEDIDPLVRAAESSPPPIAETAEELAYVLYTSGSTGQPKGVEVCRGGLANVIVALAGQLELQPGEVMLAHSAVEFDVSNLETYLPLVSGGVLYLAERGCTGSGEKLVRLLQDSGATTMLGTPTMWQLLLKAGWTGNPAFRAASGGEVLSLELAKALAGRTGAVWNHYGPTEATICATTVRIDLSTDKVTIGKPIPNVTAHVLDSRLEPVGPGVMGELYLGGAGVARGYRNRPDLTQASFVPDPFQPGSGARLYRTGDLARALPDGSLEFLGRIDTQVKLRGYRIELEEIEEQLRQLPGVDAAALSLVEIAGSQRLVAWIVSQDPLPATELKRVLRRRLPAYMVPSEFRPIEKLPMNASGKLDRRSLDGKAGVPPAELELSAKAGNEVEAKLIAIWECLLHRKIPSLTESFFELGGDSLLALLLVMQIEAEFGRKFTPDLLVEYPSIQSLAGMLMSDNNRPESKVLIPLRASGSLPPLFLVPGLGGTALLFRFLSEHLGEDQPVYAVSLPDGIVPDKNEISIEGLAARYVEEIRSVFPAGPYYLAGHSFGGLIAFEMAKQLVDLRAEVGLLALIDSDRNLGRSPGGTAPSRGPMWLLRGVRAKAWSLIEKGLVEVIRRRAGYIRLKYRVKMAEKAAMRGLLGNEFEAKELLILAGARYNPSSYAGNAVLFRATEEIRADKGGDLGWGELIAGNLELVDVAGTHLNLFAEKYVASLAERLRKHTGLQGGPQSTRA